MLLTQCAACAAPLPHLAKQCSRCKTRYCGQACQEQHWKGGHKDLCKNIRRGGDAEQYHADQKYKGVVIAAAKACADDTKGQTCYICTEAKHWKTKESLVRMCACRGTAGFAHVSCLAEQAKILLAETEENNLGREASYERWARWDNCSLCEQRYHGVVACALGWACWKTYLDRPEVDVALGLAIGILGNGLYEAQYYADAASVFEAKLAMLRRIDAPEEHIFIAQSNLASTYEILGLPGTLSLRQEIYYERLRLNGEVHEEILSAAYNLKVTLLDLQRSEAKPLLQKIMPVARRVLGKGSTVTLRMWWTYAKMLYKDDGATFDDLREAVTMLEETERTARRVLGGAHPIVVYMGKSLRDSRVVIDARGDVEALRGKFEEMAPGTA